MADEGNLGLARAFDSDEDETKADLHRRMEEARESITETVGEIKETVVNQYNSVKESVTDALDWREQFRKRPVAWSVGALGVGLVVGYNLGGLATGSHEQSDDPTSNHTRINPEEHAARLQNQAGGPSAFSDRHSYAARALSTAGTAYSSTDEALDSPPSYSSGYQPTAVDDKPGLIDRFKETRAYDRLQDEVADLGNRFMDELSNAARTVVLPALFNKLKEMIGVDLSNKRQDSGQSTQANAIGSPGRTPKQTSNQDGSAAISEHAVGERSESGKPAYPTGSGSSSKFERLASDSPAASGQSEMSPNNNLNYDDRYERESNLFSRGESRGSAPDKPGESKTQTTDSRSSASDNAPQGGDYSDDPGRKDNS